MTLTKNARAAISQFKEAEERVSGSFKKTVKRQAKIIKSDISEEEVDYIVQNPDKGKEMIQ